MKTDVIRNPPGFTPVWSKYYIHSHGGKYNGSYRSLVITTLPPDNDISWQLENAEELGFTTAKWMEKIIYNNGQGTDPTAYTAISTSHLPSDMSYRNAWRYDPDADIGNGGKGIGINTAVAKKLAKNIIRIARGNKFAELDVLFQKALEVGADTTSIVAQKQTLRDLPGQVDALNVTETTVVGVTTQIRTVWDTDLLGEYTYEDGITIMEPDQDI